MSERKYFKIGKHRFSYSLEPDEYSDQPWENDEYFGDVREFRHVSEKRPDERIFHAHAYGLRKRYLAVDWGSIARSEGPKVADMVFTRLSRYCAGDWYYCCLSVRDCATGENSYLGMIESDSDEDYIHESAFDNAWDMLRTRGVKIGIGAKHRKAKPRHGYNKTRFLEWSARNVG